MQQPTASILERLEEQHRFPGPFMFKAIGPNTAEFVAQVTQSAIVVLGAQVVPHVATKESSGGKHVSVTLRAQVRDAQQVLDIWALMGQVAGVKMVM